MDALRRRPTLAAVLVVLALVLRLAAPALHTCRHAAAPAKGAPHVGCSHTACRAHATEVARSAPQRAEAAPADSHEAECVCAVCGVVLLAPGFGPASIAEPRAPPTCERPLHVDDRRAPRLARPSLASARAPPASPGSA